MDECKSVYLPKQNEINIFERHDPSTNATLCRKTIWSQLYCMGCIRPSICFVGPVCLSTLKDLPSRFGPSIIGILEYCWNQIHGYCLLHLSCPWSMAGVILCLRLDREPSRREKNYCLRVYICRVAVFWKWKRQPVVRTSVMEPEYLAIITSAQEPIW